MGFFFNGSRSEVRKPEAASKRIPIDLLNSMGCKACPLDKEGSLRHPKMPPSGSKRPSIYILGEAPGETEDREGEPFVGDSGKLLRAQIPGRYLNREVRISNTIRCRPPDNRTPESQEIECCRRLAEDDIAETKPLAVVGMGGVPLNWLTSGKLNSIMLWRGKRIAAEIGGHRFWYYPMLHPSYVLRNQSKYGKSETQQVFERDFRNLFDDLENDRLSPPRVYHSPYDRGIEYVIGEGVEDLRRLEEGLERIARYPRIAIDLETSGLRPYDDSSIYLCSVGTFDDTLAFPLDHPECWNTTLRNKAHELMLNFLLNSGRKIAHHLGFELEWLTHVYGKRIAYLTEWDDTLAQAHTLDERVGASSLDDLTRQYFGFFLKDQSRVDAGRLLQFPVKDALRYNGMDTKWTHLLFSAQEERIKDEPKYVREYERKVRLEPSLVFTQQKGVIVDFDYAKSMEAKLNQDLARLEKGIRSTREVLMYQNRFGPFSPSAPEQVLKLMKDVCRREEIRRKDGGFTSSEEALVRIPKSEVPSASLILEHRAVSKLLSTYITPLINRKNVYGDGLIHCKFSSMIAVTGRLASEDPNLQNFPKRKYKEIRGVIVPMSGGWIVALDYGQIEARVIGMASEDRNLVRYLWTDYDIHGFWADRFLKEYGRIKDWIISEFNVPGDDDKLIRKTLRQEAKNKWVFPMFFGSSFKSCAESLHLPEMVAKDMSEEFWDEFDGVLKWQKKLIAGYEKNLYVETLGGRRRRGIMTKNELINHPIQGTAADIVLEAMQDISLTSVIEEDDELQPNINIHDDLTFNLLDSGVESKMDYIASLMCKPRFNYINVPIIVEASVGPRWDQLEEIKKYRSDEMFNIRNPYA